MNTHVSPDDLSFLTRYREIRSRLFAPKPSIPMRTTVDDQGGSVVEKRISKPKLRPEHRPRRAPMPAREPELTGPVTIDHPIAGDTLRVVAQVADMSIASMLFDDSELAVTARQVALVYLTEGAGLPGDQVESMLGMVPGPAKQALSALASQMRSKAISLTAGPEAVARALLSDDMPRRSIRVVDCRRVAAFVGGVSIDDLRSERRDMQVARVRQVAMWLARTFTRASLPEIGRQFGGRDHTTTLHAVRKLAPVAERLGPTLPPNATLEQWAEAMLSDDWHDAHVRSRR